MNESLPSASAALRGKTALVTGSSRGIGRGIALRLAQAGAKIFLTGRDEPLLRAAANEIKTLGAEAEIGVFDLREVTAAEKLVAAAIKVFGEIDILVNNAGATKRGDFLQLTEEDWQDGYALKLFGAVRLTRAAWPYLARRKGSVVNISGIGGRTPGAEFSIGGSVNSALLAFTKSIADLGVRDQVQVNAVNPGSVKTDRLGKRLQTFAQSAAIHVEEAADRMVKEAGITRFGETTDVANLVAFIVSNEGRWLQGSLIDIDGGQTKTL